MQESIKKNINELSAKWSLLNSKQRIQIISIGVALTLALIATIYLTTRSDQRVLMRNLDATTAYNLQTTLQESGIASKVIQNETAISVDAKDYEKARSATLTSGLIKDGYSFDDALNSMGMGTTSDVKKAILNHSTEAKIETTLRGINGVTDASVTLVIPDDTNFYLESKQKASASVMLTLKNDLSQDQIDGVVNNIMKAVPGLSKENIEVIDHQANILYSGEQNLNGGVSSQYKMEIQKREEISNKAKEILQPVYDNVKAEVNIVMDWDTHIESKETYETPIEGANKGLVLNEQKSNSSVKNTTTGEEAGITPNGGDINQYGTTNGGAGSDAKSEDIKTIYGLNKTQSSTEKQTGKVLLDESSMAIVVIEYITYNESDAEAQGLVNEAVTWQQFQQQTRPTALAIDANIIDSITKATGIKDLSIIGYQEPIFVDKPEVAKPPLSEYATLIILVLLIALLAFGLIRRTAPAEITELAPELSVEEVIETIGKRQEYVSPIDYDSESEVKKQIEKFVDQRPESVAQLLRNWLSSDWE